MYVFWFEVQKLSKESDYWTTDYRGSFGSKFVRSYGEILNRKHLINELRKKVGHMIVYINFGLNVSVRDSCVFLMITRKFYGRLFLDLINRWKEMCT